MRSLRDMRNTTRNERRFWKRYYFFLGAIGLFVACSLINNRYMWWFAPIAAFIASFDFWIVDSLHDIDNPDEMAD